LISFRIRSAICQLLFVEFFIQGLPNHACASSMLKSEISAISRLSILTAKRFGLQAFAVTRIAMG
jgi:hypothetical protein